MKFYEALSDLTSCSRHENTMENNPELEINRGHGFSTFITATPRLSDFLYRCASKKPLCGNRSVLKVCTEGVSDALDYNPLSVNSNANYFDNLFVFSEKKKIPIFFPEDHFSKNLFPQFLFVKKTGEDSTERQNIELNFKFSAYET